MLVRTQGGVSHKRKEGNMENKISYGEIEMEKQITDCSRCSVKDCIHRDAFRRHAEVFGGLGLCERIVKLEKLNTMERLVFAIIYEDCNENGGSCDSDRTSVCRRIKFSKHQVAGYISSLEKKGLIELVEDYDWNNDPYNRIYIVDNTRE